MKITICGSSVFRDKMVYYKKKLEEIGHEAIVHPVYKKIVDGKAQNVLEEIKEEHHKAKKKYNFVKWYYNAIKNSDAILVLNFDKNGIDNYIGGNTLMEMGFAHVHNKKVYLLNPPPEIGYRDEILATMTKTLNGDLSNL